MTGLFPNSGVPATDANNSLLDPNVVAGCSQLWHSTSRCQPRFDPAAANAVMSEIINLVNCSGLPYDCKRLDNLCIAVTDLVHDVIHGCQKPFEVADGCSYTQLVLSTDETGCTKISRYNVTQARLAVSTSCSVLPVGDHQIPVDPANTAAYYNHGDLSADAVAGTINASKLDSTRIARVNFNVPCDNMVVEVDFGTALIFNPAQNPPLGATAHVTYSIDGVFQISPDGLTPTICTYTNYEIRTDGTRRLTLNAGAHFIDFYIIATGPVRPAAVAGAACRATGTSNTTVLVTIPIQ